MTIDPDSIPASEPTYGQRLYGRKVYLVIGPEGAKGRRLEGLRVAWSIKKGQQKKPDPAKLQVYNLSADTRSFIEQDGALVQLYAGYEDKPGLLFIGQVDEVDHKRDGKDWVTEIEARDGGKQYAGGLMSETYEATDSNRIIERIAESMGLTHVRRPADLEVVTFEYGLSVFGPGRDHLDQLTESLGAEWSIQGGELVITKTGEPTGEPVVFLDTGEGGTTNTGLIRVDKTKKGIKALALSNGNIKPKGRVSIRSRKFTGLYKVTSLEHKGDSGWSQDFYTELEATPL